MTEQKSRAPVIFGGILLMLALLVSVLFSSRFMPTEDLVVKLFFNRILSWGVLSVVFVYAIKIEKQPFLLLREKSYGWWKSPLLALAVVVTIAIGAIAIGMILKALGFAGASDQSNKIIQVVTSNIWLLVFTCITAGVTEELLFRGYLFPRLALLFKNSWLAVIASSLLFAAFHAGYGTLVQFLNPLFIGLVFTLFYRKYNNITIPIVVHTAIDLSQLLPLYFHK
jgi:membrane protease YdiL (CAAX protease family)